MGRGKRIALIFVALLVLIVIVGIIAVTVIVRRPFPDTTGTVTLEGLEAEVNIYRDEYGVPHIFAESEADAYFAQGYVHAQDRFWQMEFWRHTAQGRLSEILNNENLIETDKFIRTVGWNRMAEETIAYYEEESPELMAALEAYSAGVNAYLAENRDDFSLNHTILQATQGEWEIEDWRPLDTVSWGVVMTWDLSGNWSDELRRATLQRELGEATTASLLPGYPYENRPTIAPTDQLYNLEELAPDEDEEEEAESWLPPGVDWSRVSLDIIGQAPTLDFTGIGSNNWVVSGEHTETGLPLLANDPHLGIQMPSIWYENSLHAPGLNVSGFSFAGSPGVIIGHNERMAWGVTNVGPDVQDLYIEKVNPADDNEYEYDGEWQEMTEIEEVIHVNGAEDIVLPVRSTRHGPIISDRLDDTQDVLAFSWTNQEPNRVLLSFYWLNRAENWEEFREALRFMDAPAQNFVYADVDGNIGYQMPGRIPIRSNGRGLVPVPGWTGEYEWVDMVDFEELPALYNPPQGFIVTANNAVVDEEYPYLLSEYWADGDRAERITNMILEEIEDGVIDKEDFARIQMDSKSLLGETYVDLLEGLSSDDAQVQAAIERLRGWDLQARRDSVPAALFEIFWMQLQEAVLGDELGETAREAYLSNGNPQRVFFHALAEQSGADWWDNVDTDEVESAEDIILQALEGTIEWFDENVGGDMDEWTWGTLHTARFVSDPLGQSGIGVIEQIVNRGPVPVDGSSSAVLATSWGWGNPAAVRGLPSLRMIVDLADFDASLGIHTTGQSGHPFHPHYDDFIPMWQNGEYHPLWFGEDAILEADREHLVLQPAGEE